MARRTKEGSIATRSSLIDAAECVFNEKGVSRASLNDIARAAGTTRGAIYWHFKDKPDLFAAMMDRVTLPLERAHGELAGSTCIDPVQRLRAVLALVLHSVVSDARTRRVFEIALYKVEYVGDLVAVRDRHIAASEEFTRQLALDLALAAQLQQVTLPMPPDAAAAGLHALFDGLIHNWILNDGAGDLISVGRISTDVFLLGLGLRLPVDTKVHRA